MTESLLKDWDNFYVITGSSAAGLSGLTFVVIALSAEAKRVNARGVSLFVSPTIIHFCVVLGLSALLSMPHQTALSLCVLLGTSGALGFIYSIYIGANIGWAVKGYTPVAEDWIWHVVLPIATYGVLAAAGYFIWTRTEACLYAVAAASLALMFIGIHNAWDIAVFNSLRQAGEKVEGVDEDQERQGGHASDGNSKSNSKGKSDSKKGQGGSQRRKG